AGLVRWGNRGSVHADERLTADFCGEVVVDVRLVRPHTVRPAVLACFCHGVPLDGSRGTALRVKIRRAAWRDSRVEIVVSRAGEGIRDRNVTGVPTCALPI